MKKLAGILAFLATTTAADAIVIQWDSALAPENEVPPAISLGFGSASGTVDTQTGLLTWMVEWADLTGPAVGAHFHAPAPPTANAGVVVDIGSIGGLTSPNVGSTTLSDDQVGGLLAELWYLNVHTAANPGGEIRGQVIPEKAAVIPVPATLPLLLGAGLFVGAFGAFKRKSGATG